MHKSRLLSQTKVTLPLTLEHVEVPGSKQVAFVLAFLNDRETAAYRFVPDLKTERPDPFDPWELRKEFLTCPPEHWKYIARESHVALPFGVKDFAEWVALLKAAMLRHPREWKKLEARFAPRMVRMLLEPLPVSFGWDGDAPVARISFAGIIPLIIATVQIDVLNGAQFRSCARTDCPNPPFKLEGHTTKIYCGPDCAHLVAVRNSRARAKARAAKRSSRKKLKSQREN